MASPRSLRTSTSCAIPCSTSTPRLIVGGEARRGRRHPVHRRLRRRELLDAVRAVTDLPLVLVNTHHHFDHCFGNGVLAAGVAGRPIWAHEAAAAELRDEGPRWQRAVVRGVAAAPRPGARRGARRRRVAAARPDRAHRVHRWTSAAARSSCATSAAATPTGISWCWCRTPTCVVAGDLVEQGGAAVVRGLVSRWSGRRRSPRCCTCHRRARWSCRATATSVDVDFVRAQHDELTELAWLIRDGHADGAPPEAVAAKAPFGPTRRSSPSARLRRTRRPHLRPSPTQPPTSPRLPKIA